MPRRFRRARRGGPPRRRPQSAPRVLAPPDNPYRRFFTPMPTFDDLVRRARQDARRAAPAPGPGRDPAEL